MENMKTVYVAVANLWTSKGKFLKDAEVSLPEAEVNALGKKVSSKKPKNDE